MFYKDGATQPVLGDTVLGDKLKGQVVKIGADKVTVKSKGPYNPAEPGRVAKPVLTERASAELTLMARK